jgi:hypothetical protein
MAERTTTTMKVSSRSKAARHGSMLTDCGNYVRCSAFEWRGGLGACFRTGGRSVPRRKTARGSLFSNQRQARPEPSAFHVGVTTPYRRDGPAASIPQAIGYLSPFRQTKTRQVSSKRKLLNRCTLWIHGPAREGRTRLWCYLLGLGGFTRDPTRA